MPTTLGLQPSDVIAAARMHTETTASSGFEPTASGSAGNDCGTPPRPGPRKVAGRVLLNSLGGSDGVANINGGHYPFSRALSANSRLSGAVPGVLHAPGTRRGSTGTAPLPVPAELRAPQPLLSGLGGLRSPTLPKPSGSRSPSLPMPKLTAMTSPPSKRAWGNDDGAGAGAGGGAGAGVAASASSTSGTGAKAARPLSSAGSGGGRSRSSSRNSRGSPATSASPAPPVSLPAI